MIYYRVKTFVYNKIRATNKIFRNFKSSAHWNST